MRFSGPGGTPEPSLRLLFAGGGTGGHIYMAIALAEALQKTDPASRFFFVGTPRGLEERILTPLGYPWAQIEIGGLNRVGLRRALRSLAQIPGAMRCSRTMLEDFRPDLIVGLGGYSSGPVSFAGRRMGIPLLLIEPNVLPGLANRVLGLWADRIAVAFEETQRRFGARACLTGIPVRSAFYGINPPPSREGPLQLLVFGGSQGSRPINRLMTEALPHFEGSISVVHQTGAADHAEIERLYAASSTEARVTPYLDDMPAEFAQADLVVSRAGALSVAELAAAGRASLLIPFPQSADDHQRRNAQALQRRGAAVLLEQSQTTGKKLASEILDLAADRQRLAAMGEAARSLARPDSVEAILGLIKETARKGAAS